MSSNDTKKIIISKTREIFWAVVCAAIVYWERQEEHERADKKTQRRRVWDYNN